MASGAVQEAVKPVRGGGRMPGVGGRVSLWRLPLFLPPVAWFLMEQHVKVSVTRSHLHEATASLLWRVEPMSAGRFSLTSFLLGINHSHEKNNWSSQCALFTEISIFTPNHLTNLRFFFFLGDFPFPSQWLLLYEMVLGQKKKKVLLEISTSYISIKHWTIFKHESFTLGSIRDKMF